MHAHTHACPHPHTHMHAFIHTHTHTHIYMENNELMNTVAIMVSAEFTWIPFFFLFQCGTTGRRSLISPTATNPKVVSREET